MGKAGILAIAIGVVSLGGCETMSPEACRVADWRALGYQDGAAGEGLDKFSRRQNACAKAGVQGDFNAYRLGRDEGLTLYCREDNGFQVGLRGGSYANVCPANLDGAFRTAYVAGSQAHAAISALRAVENSLASLRDDRRDIERKIADQEAALVAATTDEARQNARNELIRLRERRSSLDSDVRTKEVELSLRNQELSRVRANLGFRWGPW